MRSRCCWSGVRPTRASWAASGCFREGPWTRRRATGTWPTAQPRSASCARRPPSSSTMFRRSSSSPAGSHRRRCRSASTPTSSWPPCRGARSQRSTAWSASTSAGSRPRLRSPPIAPGRSSSSFPPSGTSSSCPTLVGRRAARACPRARRPAGRAPGGPRRRGRPHPAAGRPWLLSAGAPVAEPHDPRGAGACAPRDQASCWSSITCFTALINARWVNAWG